jgi:molybdopterin converting factor small subunit
VRTVSVRLFGQFRELYSDNIIRFDVGEDCTVEDLKNQLALVMKETAEALPLIEISALADESRILISGETLGDSSSFAILPPVSGG